jgi:F-type H+-transporting ATPase subunit a
MGKGELDILAHLQDSSTLEIFTWEIHLPTLHIWGYDLPITKHTVMIWTAALLLMLILIPVARQRELVPRKLRSLIESVLVFLRDQIAVPQMGDKGIYFVPFLATIFFFILFCNLLGLVPFGATATSNLSVTATLAAISFVTIHLSGLLHHGPLHYLKNMVPPVPFWLYPLMLAVELVGHLAKPFSLAIRLFANMLAGHIVLLVMIGFIFIFRNLLVACISVSAAVLLSCLELFIALLQAYVFTFLTAVFIGMALKSEH